MIDTSKILSQTDKYTFSLFDTNLINFQELEFYEDGVISLPLITSKVPKPKEDLENGNSDFINDAIDYGGYMWFTYNVIDHTVEMLIVEHGAIQGAYDMASVIFLMKESNHSEYAKYKLLYDEFNSSIKENIKKQIREMMTDAKGIFTADNFMKDTYFQVRKLDQQKIYYIIYRWWDKLFDGEVNFTDVVNGEGTVYIARNN